MLADTDMEADLEPSIETEERLKAEAAEAQRRQAELDRIAAEVLRQRQAAEEEQLRQAAEREQIRQVIGRPRAYHIFLASLARLQDAKTVVRNLTSLLIFRRQ